MTKQRATTCGFETDRLLVAPWHDSAGEHRVDLVDVVMSVLTPATTTGLPAEWSGDYDAARAADWIAERDAESPTLLVLERTTRVAVGLVLLFEEIAPGGIDLRLGYVLAEAAWGRGLATEVVGGLVEWAAAAPSIVSITGGVEPTNEASVKVLTKNGFARFERGQDQDTYRRFV